MAGAGEWRDARQRMGGIKKLGRVDDGKLILASKGRNGQKQDAVGRDDHGSPRNYETAREFIIDRPQILVSMNLTPAEVPWSKSVIIIIILFFFFRSFYLYFFTFPAPFLLQKSIWYQGNRGKSMHAHQRSPA